MHTNLKTGKKNGVEKNVLYSGTKTQNSSHLQDKIKYDGKCKTQYLDPKQNTNEMKIQ